MQRTQQQQVAETRPGLGRYVRGGALLLGVVVVAGVLAVASLRFVRRPILAAECAHRYELARTAADTAIVDAVGIPRKDPSFRTCGSQRTAVERGIGF